ncbi:uncharacterized protein [Procambarus clarkii]|uniref:uncharacterized protein n=1 Tax=Procambarus clarkii TaxID=6728 RepID=UPI003743A278
MQDLVPTTPVGLGRSTVTMSDYVGESLAWAGGHVMPPVALVSARETTTSWRLPRDARIVPRPSFNIPRSATVACRTASGASRSKRPAVAAAWGTLDPMATGASREAGNMAPEPPLVTVHVNNNSCAASGSEAFFNLTQHGGRRGTAISRSSSCVSAINRGAYKIHSLTPAATYNGLGRRESIAHAGRRLGRSYSVAPGDGVLSVMAKGAHVTGRRAQRLRPHLSFCCDHHVYHQHQHLTLQHQPAKYQKTYGHTEHLDKALNGTSGSMMLGVATSPPVVTQPRVLYPSVGPGKWHHSDHDAAGCTCRPCSLGVVVARAYKAVLRAASYCKYLRPTVI